MIAPGYYDAVAIEAEGPSENENTGTITISVKFKIVKGEYEGEELWWYGYFKSDRSKEISVNGLKAAGWDGDFEDLSSLRPSETVCSLNIQRDDYQGEERTKIAFVNPLGRGASAAKPMDDTSKKRFGAEMKAFMKNMTPPDARDMDDDVPFDV